MYATSGAWYGTQGEEVYPAGHHHQYPSSSYVTHSSSSSLRPGQTNPSSYQTVMGQTGGYQSPDRQTSPYNPVQQPSHNGLSVQQQPYQPLDSPSRINHQQPSATQLHLHQQSPPAFSHPRSLQAHASLSYPSPPPPHPAQLAAVSPHYPNSYPAPQYAYMDAASQYPASPQRPFSCDMCALSFNRQHDLKRHRDTHTGEKPFVCNGGCGKTFTRKDALKRHQVSPPVSAIPRPHHVCSPASSDSS